MGSPILDRKYEIPELPKLEKKYVFLSRVAGRYGLIAFKPIIGRREGIYGTDKEKSADFIRKLINNRPEFGIKEIQLVSPEDKFAEGFKRKDLIKMAKKKGIKYCTRMNKKELIKCLQLFKHE